MKKIKTYIASPYSHGNKEELVKLHFEAAYRLLVLGFNPYAPLYNHYIQSDHPDIDDNFSWLDYDKEWLEVCDILIRLHIKNDNGEEIQSPGADYEVEFAKNLGIPVFHFDTLEEMVRIMKDFKI